MSAYIGREPIQRLGAEIGNSLPTAGEEGEFFFNTDDNRLYVWTGSEWTRTLVEPNPVGTIITYSDDTAPAGYLECDGSAVSRSVYADLFDTIGTRYGAGNGSTTFNLPDLRGEFLRGWDNGRGIDAGRSLGSAQLDQFQGHHHSGDGADIGQSGSGINAVGYGSNQINNPGDPISDGTNGTPRTGSETRPRNISMMFCIKAFGDVINTGVVDVATLDAEKYGPTNLLGTVSQTGGTPTGAVIERGSNANGEYVRFADGTQMCWHDVGTTDITEATGSIFRASGGVAWTFPVFFIQAPAVNTVIDESTVAWANTHGSSATGCSNRIFSASSISNQYTVSSLAIGRWF